jgi:molybdate transport system substrate-binding protein
MKTLKALKVLFWAAALTAALWLTPNPAAALTAATGAGYKTMLEELAAAYRAQGGIIEEMYGGHIGHLAVQISQGSGAGLLISDRGTLDAAAHGVEFGAYQELGGTVLVLAWRKGLALKSPEELTGPDVKSVCLPDPHSAVYGRAAKAFLTSSGLGERLGDKVAAVSTVPQATAYLASGEMDAGFVNRTAASAAADKLGGSLEIAEGYPPIVMTAAVVKGHEDDPETKAFLAFLAGPQAKEILKKHGVW